MIIKDYICDVGLKRNLNEDTYLINQENKYVLVSDGMGGHERGDVASNIVVQTYNEIFNDSLNSTCIDENKIYDMINISNKESTLKIKKFARDYKIKNTMGATIVGTIFDYENNKCYYFHLGDSRLYKISDNKITQLTIDHSVESENKNVLSKAIGNFAAFDVDINSIDFGNNDIFFLCTDGVYNFISEDEILNIILNNTMNYSEIIKKKIYNNGARDNLTFVIVEV